MFNPRVGSYGSSDFDFDIPMLMINLEDGDVSPVNVVDQTVTGCEATKKKPEDIIEGYNNKRADEVNNIVETYSRQHKYAISEKAQVPMCKCFR